MSDTIRLNLAIADILMPEGIRALPVDPVRGMPIPWFVAWDNGKPEFRAADARKFDRALRESLCWVCGQPLTRKHAYLVGPMCAVNRVSAEPPGHRECAEYSLRACPFLSRPQMERREGGLPDNNGPGGFMIRRNPGCLILWMTKERPQPFSDGHGGVLLRLGNPFALTCWREGRPATPDEVRQSFDSGLPNLEGACGGPADRAKLARLVRDARTLLGI